jgi:hypothetical protein
MDTFEKQMTLNFESTIEKNYQSDKEFVENYSEEEAINFQREQQIRIQRESIKDIHFGAWGVQWRGADVPKPDSMYENDYTSIFGFTCAGCGVSVVNQEKLIHGKNCDSKSPYKGETEDDEEN